MRRDTHGFTLLEVLIAVFVFATVIGALISMVSGNLARLGDARRELDRMQRAERLVREAETDARLGLLPEVGTTGETFEPPDDDLRWERVVEPFVLPLPKELVGSELQYSLFTPPAPGRSPEEGQEGLRLVQVWVFPADAERDSVEPFSVLVGLEPESVGDGAAPEGAPPDEAGLEQPGTPGGVPQ